MTNRKSITIKIIFEVLKGIFYCAVPLCILFVGIISQTKNYVLDILMIILTIVTFIAYTNWIKIAEYIKDIETN